MFLNVETTVPEKLSKVKNQYKMSSAMKNQNKIPSISNSNRSKTFTESLSNMEFPATQVQRERFSIPLLQQEIISNTWVNFYTHLNVTYLIGLLNAFPTLIYSFKSTYTIHLDLTKPQGYPGCYSGPHFCSSKASGLFKETSSIYFHYS